MNFTTYSTAFNTMQYERVKDCRMKRKVLHFLPLRNEHFSTCLFQFVICFNKNFITDTSVHNET